MRVILHSDLNNFYASCEQLYNPALKNLPFAVCGSVEERHGIVLAKNHIAKAAGVKTAMTIKTAMDLCPNLLCVEAHFDRYMDLSEKVRKIYLEYTDYVEPFGIDEAWLDVTNSKIFGSGVQIADQLRERVKKLGLTVSVGVSFNKIFAKLGSDMKKPDATTEIPFEGYKNLVWPLPVNELLMVGRKTAEKLAKFNVYTIGDLAAADSFFLEKKLGKMGVLLHEYANGRDVDPVSRYYELDEAKSIGNSMTCYRDLKSYEDVHVMLSVICESISQRALKKGFMTASTLSIMIRDEALESFTRQAKLTPPSIFHDDLLSAAEKLFLENFDFSKGIRSIGVAISGFSSGEDQLSMFQDAKLYAKKMSLAKAVSGIHDKYGAKSLMQATNIQDIRVYHEDPENNHVVHPKGRKSKD